LGFDVAVNGAVLLFMLFVLLMIVLSLYSKTKKMNDEWDYQTYLPNFKLSI